MRYRLSRRLRSIVDSSPFNITIAILIIISVTLIFVEHLLPPGIQRYEVEDINNIITWIFVIELSMRYFAAPNKRIFFTNYWIDILAVLPVLRIFRTLRVIRLLRVLRLIRAVIILMRQSGWVSSRFERLFGSFGALILATIMFILCGAVALLSLDSSQGDIGVTYDVFLNKILQSSFLFVSGEIVGPLDTTWGKVVALAVSVAGLVIFAVLVGTVSASMAAYFKTKVEMRDMELKDLAGHLIICGWDRVGAVILSELEEVREVWEKGVVVVAETDENIMGAPYLKNRRRLFHIKEDFTKIEVLESAGAKRARRAIVLADKGANLGDQDRDARTVLAALTLEKLNPKIFTCAELLSEVNGSHLRLAGVEEIISRTNITAGLFAASAVNEGVTSVMSDILTHKEGNYMKKVPIPEEFVGRSFADLSDHFKREFDVTIIALENRGEKGGYVQHVNPSASRVLQSSDRATLILRLDSALCELKL